MYINFIMSSLLGVIQNDKQQSKTVPPMCFAELQQLNDILAREIDNYGEDFDRKCKNLNEEFVKAIQNDKECTKLDTQMKDLQLKMNATEEYLNAEGCNILNMEETVNKCERHFGTVHMLANDWKQFQFHNKHAILMESIEQLNFEMPHLMELAESIEKERVVLEQRKNPVQMLKDILECYNNNLKILEQNLYRAQALATNICENLNKLKYAGV